MLLHVTRLLEGGGHNAFPIILLKTPFKEDINEDARDMGPDENICPERVILVAV